MTPIKPECRIALFNFLQDFQETWQTNSDFQQTLKEILVVEVSFSHLPFYAQPKATNLLETMRLFLECYYLSNLEKTIKSEQLLEVLKQLKILKLVGVTESEAELRQLFSDCQDLPVTDKPVIPEVYDTFLWFFGEWEMMLINEIRQLTAGNRAEQLTGELLTIFMNAEKERDDSFPKYSELMALYDSVDGDVWFESSKAILAGKPYMEGAEPSRLKYVVNPPIGYHEKVAELVELRCFDFYLSMGMLLEMTETLETDLHNVVYSYLKTYFVI